jgi:hypothetical protein
MHAESLDTWRHEHVFLGKHHARNERRSLAVVTLCGTMMTAEIVGGWLWGSMALIADGLHMSTHAGALVSAWLLQAPTDAADQSAPARGHAHAHARGRGRGHHHHHDHADHNLRAAYVHVMADAAVSLLALVGLATARAIGWLWIDPAMGVVGMLVILNWSWSLVRAASAVLLDRRPEGAEGASPARSPAGSKRSPAAAAVAASPICICGESGRAAMPRSSHWSPPGPSRRPPTRRASPTSPASVTSRSRSTPAPASTDTDRVTWPPTYCRVSGVGSADAEVPISWRTIGTGRRRTPHIRLDGALMSYLRQVAVCPAAAVCAAA